MFAGDPAFAPQMGGSYVVVPRPQPRPARVAPRPVAPTPPRSAPVPQPRTETATVAAVRPVVVPPPEDLGIRVDAGPALPPQVVVPDAGDLGISLE